MEQFCSDSGCGSRVRCSSGRIWEGCYSPCAEIQKDEGDGDSESDRVLRTYDLPQTFKRGLAPAMCKGHRVLHANKEIRLNNEALGTHVASEASSPLVQELGGRFSLRVRSVAL